MKRIIICAAVLLVATTLSAQELKSYSGSFKGGEATYTYFENDDGRVFEGKFHWSGPASLLGIGTLEIVGSFKKNKRDGLWAYSVTPEQSQSVRIFFLVNYANGVPDGRYEYKVTGKGGKRSLITTMKNGRADGPVKIEVPSVPVLGMPSSSVITGMYSMNKRTGVWERKFSNGSYYHIVCNGSKASYYVSEYWGDWVCSGDELEGSYFYDMEDGSKRKASEYEMLRELSDLPIDGSIHNFCFSLEKQPYDFGLVIPKEEPNPTPNGNAAMSQSNTQGVSERALSPEEVKLLYEQKKAEQNNAKTETEKLLENLGKFGIHIQKKKK